MPAPNRQRLIRLIHVAKRDLSMDDDTYRAILLRIGKKASSADLTIPELEKVLEHLKRSGFKVRSKAKSAQAKPSRPLAQDGESKKIRALWLFLHELGAVKNPSEEALAAYDGLLALKADAPQVLHNRGLVLHDLGRLDEALRSAKARLHARRADPNVRAAKQAIVNRHASRAHRGERAQRASQPGQARGANTSNDDQLSLGF